MVAVGAISYISAVSQRSSLGVASLAAADRFHTTAEQLSLLAVLQLFVYAAMQIPVGLLLDRFGPRLLLALGGITMAVGQFTVAGATQLSWAIAGRMLVGFGDAFTFISLIRLVNGWYSGKRASQLQQWLGNGGQVGQILSAVPFGALLKASGWFTAFTSWASAAGIVSVLVWVLVVDERVSEPHPALHIRERLQVLLINLGKPSTRMAFWTHFMTQSSTTVIALLWGVPFLETGEGLSHSAVVAILSSYVIIGFGVGVVFGQICAHKPNWRRPALTLTTSTMILSWIVLLLWPGSAPGWLIALWVLSTAINGPASMVAMDYTRQYVPKSQLGSVNGFVNIGGFSATLTMMFVVGVLLDSYFEMAGRELGLGLYSLNGFRVAFTSVVLIIGFGLWRYLRNERLCRAVAE
ncbi:MAG: nitrate/nitrite transporter [Micrococcales bacterium]